MKNINIIMNKSIKTISLISVLVIVGVVGIAIIMKFVFPLTLQPQTSQLPPSSATTTNWKLYRNKEYGFEFRYPKEWGELKIELPENESDFSYKKILTQQIENGVFSFIPENSKIVKVWYHPKSKTLAFVKKGKEIIMAGETWYQGQLYAGKDLNFSLVFEIPEEVAKWYGNIPDLSFSPDGKYVAFVVYAWEEAIPYIINLQTKRDILEIFSLEKEKPWIKDIYIEDLYKDVLWTPNSQSLAIKSIAPEIGGHGIEAIIVSEYQNPEKLSVVFSFDQFGETLDWIESDIFAPQFSEDDKVLQFQARLKFKEKKNPILKAYQYNLVTKELKEIEIVSNWKTYKDKKHEFEFKYPEKLDTEFIEIYPPSWPPKVEVKPLDPNFICKETSDKEKEGYKARKVVINNHTYCIFTRMEGAAGKAYFTYQYITNKEEKQVTLTFTLIYPSCGVFEEEKMKRCEKEEEVFNPDLLADQILSTFQFIDTKDATNWKTYRNEKYGFEFKYPYYSQENQPKESKDKKWIHFRWPSSLPYLVDLHVNVGDNPHQLSLRDWILQNPSPCILDLEKEISQNVKEIYLDNKKAILLESSKGTCPPGADKIYVIVYVAHNNKIFTVKLQGEPIPEDLIASLTQEFIEKFLPTFKFLD